MRSRLTTLTRRHILPLTFYTLLALLMTWPLAQQFTRATPGDSVDSWQNMWNMWWLKQALLQGRNPFFTDVIYYPEGVSLLLHTLNPFNFLVSLPVHALFGLVVAYNTMIIFSIAVSGYGAYLLAADAVGDRRAALIGGTVFAASGYVLAQALGHLNLIAVEWLPFAALALRRANMQPGPRWRWIVSAGFFIALNALCDWQYLIFALIWAGWYALAAAWSKRDLRAAGPSVAAIALALALATPLLIPTAYVAANTEKADTGAEHRLNHSADLVDLFIPSQLHAWWGDAAARAQSYKDDILIQNKTAYLGTVALALALIGARQREGRFWAASALLFVVLALGPRLFVGGVQTPIPLPAALIYQLPFVNISRVPLRFVTLATLALAVLAAFGARALLNRSAAAAPPEAREYGARTSKHLRSGLITAALIGLLALDNLTAPFPLVGIYVPPIYAELGQDAESYAILESPAYARTSLIYMFYQTIHDKDLVGGIISREQPYPLVEQFPTVRMFMEAGPVYDIIGQDRAEIAPSLLSAFNIRYLMLHSDGGGLRYNTLQRVARAAAGGADPRVEEIPGRSFLIYRVVPPDRPRPFIGIGRGWTEPEVSADNRVTRTIREEAEVLIYNGASSNVEIELEALAAQPGRLDLSADGHDLPPVTLRAGAQRVVIPLELADDRVDLLLRPGSAITVTRIDVISP